MLLPQENMNRVLRTIANTAIINYENLNDNSLCYGKMGVCLYFYEYAKYSNCKVFQIVADSLWHDIAKSTYRETNSNISCGFTGIGVGAIYLLSKGFAHDNINELLSDIDNHIINESISISERDLMTPHPVCSAALYILHRISNCPSNILTKMGNSFESLMNNYLEESPIDDAHSMFCRSLKSVLNILIEQGIFIDIKNPLGIDSYTTPLLNSNSCTEDFWYIFLYKETTYLDYSTIENIINYSIENIAYGNYNEICKIVVIGFLLLQKRIIIN